MRRLRSAHTLSGPTQRPLRARGGLILAVLGMLVPQAGATAHPERIAGANRFVFDAEPSSARSCADAVAGKLPIHLALRHYIKQAVPTPKRFLVAAGTDSALPESAVKVLQEFGPMYYYAGSEAAKAKVRERLDIVGPYPALLVVMRKAPSPTASTEIIRLGGHYVTGEYDGKHALSTEYNFVCTSAGWEMKGVKSGVP